MNVGARGAAQDFNTTRSNRERGQFAIISLGGGVSSAAASLKNNVSLGNGFHVGADVFFPLFRKGWDGTVKGNSFALGVSVLADYSKPENILPGNDAAVADKYKVISGETNVVTQAGGDSWGSFAGMLGVQGLFSLGRFNVAPSIHAGYLQLKPSGFVQQGSAEINGQHYEAALTKLDAQKISGLVYMPQVKFGYSLTPRLSFFISPSVMWGPEVKRTTQHLVPQGGFNDRNTYEVKQLAGGTWENEKVAASRYNFVRVNFGVSVVLGGASKKPTLMPSRLSMTPTTTRQTQGRTFGEKVASGLRAMPAETPNPLYENNGNGGDNPLFESAGKGINEAGIKKTEAAKKEGTRTYTAGRKNEPQQVVSTAIGGGATSGGATSSSYAAGRVAGGPLKGIDVKLGKSPNQGIQARATSNKKGEVVFKALNPGIYELQIGQPPRAEAQDFNTTRNNRERGQFAAKPGTPIGGIIVKGGKNPGGNMTNFVVAPGGTVKFEVLEAGDYKFVVQEPASDR